MSALRALAFLLICVPAVAAADPPRPLVMGPLYTEAAPASASSAPLCPVTIAELSDARRAPEMLGMMNNRAIVAPADREAWLHSVFEVGLRVRGFSPTFAELAADDNRTLAMRVHIRSIWMTTVGMNKTAAVVVRVAQGRGSELIETDYRGDVVLANWAGTQTEFNGAVERAFARALDAIAADLRPQCASPTAAP